MNKKNVFLLLSHRYPFFSHQMQTVHWSYSEFKSKDADGQILVSEPQMKTSEKSTLVMDWACMWVLNRSPSGCDRAGIAHGGPPCLFWTHVTLCPIVLWLSLGRATSPHSWHHQFLFSLANIFTCKHLYIHESQSTVLSPHFII